jgi:hypothetical protein
MAPLSSRRCAPRGGACSPLRRMLHSRPGMRSTTWYGRRSSRTQFSRSGDSEFLDLYHAVGYKPRGAPHKKTPSSTASVGGMVEQEHHHHHSSISIRLPLVWPRLVLPKRDKSAWGTNDWFSANPRMDPDLSNASSFIGGDQWWQSASPLLRLALMAS